MSRRTTFQRAASGYDPDFENTLVDAIAATIGEVLMVTDADCIAIRTAETASALVAPLAVVFALSPAASRSPTAVRKTVDELGKRLRCRLTAVNADPHLQGFIKRISHGNDVESSA